MVMLVPVLSSSSSKPALAKDASKGIGARMACSLTLDACSNLASTASKVTDMSSFRSARQRQERINAARISLDPKIHSPSLSGVWRQRRPSMFSTPPTRSTMLPPPPPSLPLRPPPPSGNPYPANMPESMASFNGQGRSMIAGEDSVPVSRVLPGPVWPSANQLKVAYTYGIRREDGTYTRLIRADELNSYDFECVPVSQGPEGMIILPAPQQPRLEQRDGPEMMISNDIIQTLPVIGLSRPQPVDDTQMQIDSIVAQASLSPPTPSKASRKEKIYCDKWIHEGVCAFTQLGCKYKHEMPMDKATQLSLGLNHGLPTWYKRAQAVQIRPESQSSDSAASSIRTSGPWRRANAVSSSPTGPSIRGGIQASSAVSPQYGTTSFGPIAPPMPHMPASQPFRSSNNPFSLLSTDMKADDDDEDNSFIWRGRGH